MPLLVLSVLGAAANSSFFVAWTIASALEIASLNFGTSLLVEGIRAPGRLAELTRGILFRCGLITVCGAAAMAAGGHIILRLFGPAYGDASLLLTLLGTATIPISIVIVALTLDRIAGRVGRVALTQLALAVLVLGISVPLMKKLGIDGVGFAWLSAGLVVAVVRAPTIVHVIRQPSAPVLVPRPGHEPVLAGRHRDERAHDHPEPAGLGGSALPGSARSCHAACRGRHDRDAVADGVAGRTRSGDGQCIAAS